MLRLTVTVILALFLSLLASAPASASSADDEIDAFAEDDKLTTEAGDRTQQQEQQNATQSENEPANTEPAIGAWRASVVPSTEDPGSFCVDRTFVFGVDPESGTAAEWAAQEAFYLRGDTIDEMGGAGFELCAGTPTDEMTADLVAPGFVRQVRLPAIEPRIDPGFAITGLPAYLVVENQDDFLYSTDIPGWGTLAADFRLERVEVDWGDGTDPQIYTDGRRGAPYDGPAGLQISHDYRNVDTDNQVEVTTTWSAEWSLAGASGTVAGMSTTTDLELPIREYRAVRVAP